MNGAAVRLDSAKRVFRVRGSDKVGGPLLRRKLAERGEAFLLRTRAMRRRHNTDPPPNRPEEKPIRR
jgi:hypothetical protein